MLNGKINVSIKNIPDSAPEIKKWKESVFAFLCTVPQNFKLRPKR